MSKRQRDRLDKLFLELMEDPGGADFLLYDGLWYKQDEYGDWKPHERATDVEKRIFDAKDEELPEETR